MKKPFFILIILAIFLSEISLKLNVLVGCLVYAVLVGVILISLEKDRILEHSEKLLLFLAIVPIARIAECFIKFDVFFEAIIFYSILLFLVIYYVNKFRVDLGYELRTLIYLPFTIAIGFLLGFIGDYFFIFDKNTQFLFLLPIIALSEEILFRGMIQNFAKKEYGSSFSILFVSLLVSTFSLSFGISFALFMFISNLIICFIYDKTDNVWLTIPINFIMNLFLFIFSFKILL
jgi:membrane protease YdiL (CAAX protease family)